MKINIPQTPEQVSILRYILDFIALMALLFTGSPDLMDTLIDILRHSYLGQ